jgi:F-type H+-transporting ATPase subunit delta
MNASKISVRYATALFGLALERNILEKVYRDMKVISRISSMEEVKGVIGNPVIPIKKRKEIVIALAGDDADALTVRFITLMFDQGRGDFLGAAARNVIDLTRRHRGIREVTLTTAVPVGESLRKEMAILMEEQEAGEIEFIEKIDESVIGGFILRVDDAYIDASVKNRLNRFRKEFSLAGYAEE